MNRHEPEFRYERGSRVAVIRNMVVSPQGRIYKRPKSRVKLAWMALRGWEIYGK